MTPVVNVVHASAWGLAPRDAYVPSPLWGVFAVIHKVHRVWRWYNKAEIYSNPKNFYQLVAGHVLNFIFEDSVMLRIAAQAVLISSRILKCVKQVIAVSRTCSRCKDAWQGKYVQRRTMSKTSFKTAKVYAAYQKDGFHSFVERIEQVAFATFKVFKSLFILSMRFMDAIESFSLSPETKNEAIAEIFLNAISTIDDLVHNQRALLECLEDNKPLVADILDGVGSRITVEQLIDAVRKTVGIAETAQTITHVGGGVFVNLLQHGLEGATGILRLSSFVPLSLKPKNDDPPFLDIKLPSDTPTKALPVSASTKARMAKSQAG